MMIISILLLILYLILCAGFCTSNIKFCLQIGLCPLLCQSSCVYNRGFYNSFDCWGICLNLLTDLKNRNT